MALTFGYTVQLRDRFTGGYKSLSKSFQQLGEDGVKAGNELNFLAGALIGAAGAAAGFAALTVAVSADVEKSLRQVAAVSSDTSVTFQSSMDSSVKSALAFSTAFVGSTGDIIKAQFELATAGLNVQEQLSGAKASALLAKAAFGELTEAATLVGSIMNTFGQGIRMQYLTSMEKAVRITDVFAATVKEAQVTLPVMIESLKFVVGSANALNLSLEEVVSTIGILNTAGLRASLAGTTLNNIFVQLGDAIDTLNLQPDKFLDVEGNIKSLASVLREVERATGALAPFEKFTALIDGFDIRGARAVTILLTKIGEVELKTLEKQFNVNVAEDLAKTIQENLISQLEILGQTVQNIGIIFGNKFLGVVKSVTGVLQGMAKALQKMTGGPLGDAGAAFVVLTLGVGGLGAAFIVFTKILIAIPAVLTATAAGFTAMGAAGEVAAASLLKVSGAMSVLLKTFIGFTVLATGFALAWAIVREEIVETAVAIEGTKFDTLTNRIKSITGDLIRLRSALEAPSILKRENIDVGKSDLASTFEGLNAEQRKDFIESGKDIEAAIAGIAFESEKSAKIFSDEFTSGFKKVGSIAKSEANGILAAYKRFFNFLRTDIGDVAAYLGFGGTLGNAGIRATHIPVEFDADELFKKANDLAKQLAVSEDEIREAQASIADFLGGGFENQAKAIEIISKSFEDATEKGNQALAGLTGGRTTDFENLEQRFKQFDKTITEFAESAQRRGLESGEAWKAAFIEAGRLRGGAKGDVQGLVNAIFQTQIFDDFKPKLADALKLNVEDIKFDANEQIDLSKQIKPGNTAGLIKFTEEARARLLELKTLVKESGIEPKSFYFTNTGLNQIDRSNNSLKELKESIELIQNLEKGADATGPAERTLASTARVLENRDLIVKLIKAGVLADRDMIDGLKQQVNVSDELIKKGIEFSRLALAFGPNFLDIVKETSAAFGGALDAILTGQGGKAAGMAFSAGLADTMASEIKRSLDNLFSTQIQGLFSEVPLMLQQAIGDVDLFEGIDLSSSGGFDELNDRMRAFMVHVAETQPLLRDGILKMLSESAKKAGELSGNLAALSFTSTGVEQNFLARAREILANQTETNKLEGQLAALSGEAIRALGTENPVTKAILDYYTKAVDDGAFSFTTPFDALQNENQIRIYNDLVSHMGTFDTSLLDSSRELSAFGDTFSAASEKVAEFLKNLVIGPKPGDADFVGPLPAPVLQATDQSDSELSNKLDDLNTSFSKANDQLGELLTVFRQDSDEDNTQIVKSTEATEKLDSSTEDLILKVDGLTTALSELKIEKGDNGEVISIAAPDIDIAITGGAGGSSVTQTDIDKANKELERKLDKLREDIIAKLRVVAK